MVRLIRSGADRARYWHRLDDRGCGESRLVQPDRDERETDVATRDLGEFFEYADRDPCPECDWEHH
jgi:hypothetical protein